MATMNNDNAPSSGSGKSSVNTQENTSTTNTNDSTSSISSSGIESLNQDNNKSDLGSSSESLKQDEGNDRFDTLWQGAEQAGIVKDAPGERKEVSAEQLYIESLKGNAGKSSQDLAFGDLIESKKSNSDDDNDDDNDFELENSAIKNAYQNYTDFDLRNETYKDINTEALRNFEQDRANALKSIRKMGEGLKAYNDWVNDLFVDDKNITFGSEKKAKLFKDYRKNGNIMNTAKNLSKGDGFKNYIGELFGSKIDNAKHNVTNTLDNIYTMFGGTNAYGNTWSETHGGEKLDNNANWLERVGSNMWQVLKNTGDKFDVALGGADNQTGLNKYGMKADLDGDGKISLNERLDNIVTGLAVGNNASKYDLDLDGHLDKYETADALSGRLLGSLAGQSLVEDSKKENEWDWENKLKAGLGHTLNTVDIITNPLKSVAAGLGGLIKFANNNARNGKNQTNRYVADDNGTNNDYINISPQIENLTVKPKTTASNIKKEGWDDMIEKNKAKLKEKLSKKKNSSVISDERLKTFITNTWINDSTIKDLMMMNLLQNKVKRYV